MSRSDGAVRPGVRPLGSATPVLAALGLAACGGGSGPATVAPPPPLAPLGAEARLYYDNSGGVTEPLREVLRDRAAFEEAWARATSRQNPPPAAPSLDFGEEMALLVSTGRMTPEDRIRVDSVGVRTVVDAEGRPEDVLAVVVRTLVGCGRFQVDAHPVEIVRVPAFEGEVRFVERREQDPGCDSAATALR